MSAARTGQKRLSVPEFLALIRLDRAPIATGRHAAQRRSSAFVMGERLRRADRAGTLRFMRTGIPGAARL